MRRVISWLLNLTGWTLDGRELAKIAGGSILGSGVMSAVLEFIRSLPIPILISIIIGMAILLFVGFSYLLDTIKKGKPSNQMGKRTGIRMRGGKGEFTDTTIRDQDTAMDIEDTDLNLKDTDIK